MNQIETLQQVKNQFSLTGLEHITYTETVVFTHEKIRNMRGELMEQPVNNYLKSPEEMEAEFCFVINSRKAAFSGIDDRYDSYGRLNKKTDGYMNIHNLDETLSGFMEENY